MFYRRNDAAENKMTREMPRFTVLRAGAKVGGVRRGEVLSRIARRLVMVGSRWRWVAAGGAVLLQLQRARRLYTVLSKCEEKAGISIAKWGESREFNRKLKRK